MSGPYQRPYPLDRQGTYPGTTGSPLSPSPATGPVPSFKTNVNRTKTKRWVEAKSYSYDGGDWGDDDEYEDEHTPAAPAPPAVPPLAKDAGSRSNSAHRSEDRSLSLDRSGGQDRRHDSPSRLTPDKPADASADASSESADQAKLPTFIRPADIYKRMQKEREKERRSQETAPSESDSVGPTSHVENNRDQDPSSPGDSTATPSQAVPSLSLPEVKRLSGFGHDFLGDTNQSSQETQPADNAAPGVDPPPEPALHHNPSLGFRSVVNQAFDVPETPSSTVDSVVRSNSDSTSVISPIMSNRILDSEKTPTITEEPGEMAAAKASAPVFQPGYRRSLTAPASGNAPARVPAVSTAELPQPEPVETSSVTPSQSQESLDEHPAQNEPELDNETAHAPSPEPTKAAPDASAAGDDSQADTILQSIESDDHQDETERSPVETSVYAPAPLRIPSGARPPEPSAVSIPEILPSLSTETSPQDMESDRLRKEIIRSLSPESPETKDSSTQAPQSDHLEPPSAPRVESTDLPTEYDSYWDEQPDITPTSPLRVSSKEPLTLTINPKPSNEATSAERSDDADSQQPQLKKRFSWEESDDSEIDILEEPAEPSSAPPQTSEKQPQPEEKEAPPDVIESKDTDVSDQIPTPEKDTVTKDTVTSQPEPALEKPQKSGGVPPTSQSQKSQPSSQLGEAKLPGFRQILDIQSPEKRIRVFNETREQFAVIDSGLADWIRATTDALPEHAHLLQLNGQLPTGGHRPAPSKTKFPKLSSLGNLSLASHPDGSPQAAGTSHARRPSGAPLRDMINRQNVEARGKDLLHSAGMLGGKAGGAARGLFAKGRNKLRGNAGGDKVD
ncbi:hypothetical protein VTN77DRAFT_2284 [Rasamsonia byssochlamydoides]|uniref:uncharacterized protein n=1 Tax=Rasamsonia byssochlamydoides TaxID=89139 RepID=UPI003743AC13